MSIRVATSLAVLLFVAACGGGGGDGPTGVSSNPTKECVKEQVLLRLGRLTNTGDGDSGPGGGAGAEGASGDGDGALGQFRHTVFIVRDRNLQEIARTVTDATGMVNIRLPGGCIGPLEVEYQGGPTAQYFDESTGRFEPFPDGYRLRARYPSLPPRFGVTPYTEAAVRLMEATAGRVSTVLDPDEIRAANDRIAEILTDQVPGAYRSANDGSFAPIDITIAPVTLNDQNARLAGTLGDDPSGRYGAVVAGLAVASGTFGATGTGGALAAPSAPGGSAPTVKQTQGLPPALRAMLQLADDLSDGNLDLQGAGGAVLAADEAPAYTYETMWRSKTIAAGLTTQEAGSAALEASARAAIIAEYQFSFSKVYLTATCIGAPNCDPYEARSTGSQTVRLHGDGRLTLQRAMSAAFGPDRSYRDARTDPAVKEVVVNDPLTGRPLRFVDVKVGSRGEILALRQDRRGIAYIDPMALYTVRGDEDPDDPANVQRLRQLLDDVSVVLIDLAGQGNARVVSFTPSPAQRTFPGPQAPDFLYVLSDGTLRGGFRGTPGGVVPSPIALPQPARLQAVVYDKFVPPGSDARYGRAVPAGTQLPWQGPRRLYGLTRAGEVIAWLEGETASGVRLDVPGTVVLLAAESKTSVYALTAQGEVYRINADQSHVTPSNGVILQRPTLADFPRRFALHQVTKVGGLAAPICWLARTEAIACRSGELFRWDEVTAKLNYGPSNLNSALVPTDGDIVASKVDGLPRLWRLSAVDAFYSQRFDGEPSLFVEGLRLITVAGAATGLEEALGQRNLLTTLRAFPEGSATQHPYLTGPQMRVALQSLFSPAAPLAQGLAKASTTPRGHGLVYRIAPVGQDLYDLSLAVDGDGSLQHPGIDLLLEFRASAGAVDHFRAVRLHGGDRDTVDASGAASDQPLREPHRFDDGQFFPLERTAFTWDLWYRVPLKQDGPVADSGLRAKIIPMAIPSRPYEFRLCFHVEGQSSPASIRFARLACTVHDNAGRFIGRGSGVSAYSTYSNGARTPPGNTRQVDFGHVYDGE
jgi:hypothetical protein